MPLCRSPLPFSRDCFHWVSQMLRGRTAACVYFTDAVKVLRERKVPLSKKTIPFPFHYRSRDTRTLKTWHYGLIKAGEGRCHCDSIDSSNQGRLQHSVSTHLSLQLHVQSSGLLQVNQSAHNVQALIVARYLHENNNNNQMINTMQHRHSVLSFHPYPLLSCVYCLWQHLEEHRNKNQTFRNPLSPNAEGNVGLLYMEMRHATQSSDEVSATCPPPPPPQSAACLLQLCCCTQGITASAGVI